MAASKKTKKTETKGLPKPTLKLAERKAAANDQEYLDRFQEIRKAVSDGGWSGADLVAEVDARLVAENRVAYYREQINTLRKRAARKEKTDAIKAAAHAVGHAEGVKEGEAKGVVKGQANAIAALVCELTSKGQDSISKDELLARLTG
jgi:hypothetical protein